MTTVTEPQLDSPSNTDDDHRRHFVERLTPEGYLPARYAKKALCGTEVKDLVEHNGEICQECVDILRKRGSK